MAVGQFQTFYYLHFLGHYCSALDYLELVVLILLVPWTFLELLEPRLLAMALLLPKLHLLQLLVQICRL